MTTTGVCRSSAESLSPSQVGACTVLMHTWTLRKSLFAVAIYICSGNGFGGERKFAKKFIVTYTTAQARVPWANLLVSIPSRSTLKTRQISSTHQQRTLCCMPRTARCARSLEPSSAERGAHYSPDKSNASIVGIACCFSTQLPDGSLQQSCCAAWAVQGTAAPQCAGTWPLTS